MMKKKSFLFVLDSFICTLVWLAMAEYLFAFILYNHYPMDDHNKHMDMSTSNQSLHADGANDEFGPMQHSKVEV